MGTVSWLGVLTRNYSNNNQTHFQAGWCRVLLISWQAKNNNNNNNDCLFSTLYNRFGVHQNFQGVLQQHLSNLPPPPPPLPGACFNAMCNIQLILILSSFWYQNYPMPPPGWSKNNTMVANYTLTHSVECIRLPRPDSPPMEPHLFFIMIHEAFAEKSMKILQNAF